MRVLSSWECALEWRTDHPHSRHLLSPMLTCYTRLLRVSATKQPPQFTPAFGLLWTVVWNNVDAMLLHIVISQIHIAARPNPSIQLCIRQSTITGIGSPCSRAWWQPYQWYIVSVGEKLGSIVMPDTHSSLSEYQYLRILCEPLAQRHLISPVSLWSCIAKLLAPALDRYEPLLHRPSWHPSARRGNLVIAPLQPSLECYIHGSQCCSLYGKLQPSRWVSIYFITTIVNKYILTVTSLIRN